MNLCFLNKNAFIRKENFEKGLLNLIETNHQINMTSDNFVSSNNSFKSYLNAKFRHVFNTVAVVRSTLTLLWCLLLQGDVETDEETLNVNKTCSK